jgi:hypothetical protein
MQTFKTITQQQTITQDSVYYAEAHKVLENTQKEIATCVFDSDCTAARQYIMLANVFASLTQCFYNSDNEEYIALDNLMQCFAHLTYYDDSYIYDDCVRNTALEKIKLLDYVHLSN